MPKLTAHLDRFEGEKAVLIIGASKLMVDRSHLPPHCREGEVLVITIQTDRDVGEQQSRHAKDVLNEILKNSRP